MLVVPAPCGHTDAERCRLFSVAVRNPGVCDGRPCDSQGVTDIGLRERWAAKDFGWGEPDVEQYV